MIKREGFTLVELSIVLIIGLLIGGILAGQSMVDTSRVQSQIRQLQQFDIAASNFKLNYNRLPGDANKNGYVQADYNCPISTTLCTAQYVGTEPLNFFPELSLYGHLTETYRNTTNLGAIGPSKSLPKAAIGKGGIVPLSGFNMELLYLLGAIRDDPASGPVTTTFYALLYDADSGGNRGIVTPQQALALDTKLDDGLPGTGIIRAFYWNATLAADYGQPPFAIDTGQGGTGQACAVSSKYKSTSSNNPTCLISIVAGVTAN